jgi:hypothetical protein
LVRAVFASEPQGSHRPAEVVLVHRVVRQDYYQQGKRWWFRLHETCGKRHDVPAHHKAEEYMDAYTAAAGGLEEPSFGRLAKSSA